MANTGTESVYTAPTIYTSASGLHATINVGDGPANCPAGTKTSSEMIVSMLLQPGQMPIATEVWCAPNAGGGHMNYPPISTTSDGVSADALVWFMSGSQLEAVDGDTGKQVVTDHRRGVRQRAEHELPDRREEPHRRVRPGAPVLVVRDGQ